MQYDAQLSRHKTEDFDTYLHFSDQDRCAKNEIHLNKTLPDC